RLHRFLAHPAREAPNSPVQIPYPDPESAAEPVTTLAGSGPRRQGYWRFL
ncbi:hypothetical protein PoMZ_01048, partial [Pyricularia oryzae]